MFRNGHIESVDVTVEGIRVGSGNDVLRFVGQQVFDNRQRGGRLPVFQSGLILGNAQAIVQMARPGQCGDPLEPVDLLIGHELATDIALGHKGEIICDLPLFLFQLCLKDRIVGIAVRGKGTFTTSTGFTE